MKIILIVTVFLMSLFIVGCYAKHENKTVTTAQAASDQELRYIEALNWVKNADVNQDVNTAIAKQDYRLFVLAGRGQSMPGIGAQQKQKLMKLCGSQILPGSIDMIKNNQHRQLLKKAVDYAEQYNRLMAKICGN